MRLETRSFEGHIGGTHFFFLFLLNGVFTFLSDLSTGPSSVLCLPQPLTLGPGAEDGRDWGI